jgi:hypothetical protein
MMNLLIVVLSISCGMFLYVEGRGAGRREEIERQKRMKRNLSRLTR